MAGSATRASAEDRCLAQRWLAGQYRIRSLAGQCPAGSSRKSWWRAPRPEFRPGQPRDPGIIPVSDFRIGLLDWPRLGGRIASGRHPAPAPAAHVGELRTPRSGRPPARVTGAPAAATGRGPRCLPGLGQRAPPAGGSCSFCCSTAGSWAALDGRPRAPAAFCPCRPAGHVAGALASGWLAAVFAGQQATTCPALVSKLQLAGGSAAPVQRRSGISARAGSGFFARTFGGRRLTRPRRIEWPPAGSAAKRLANHPLRLPPTQDHDPDPLARRSAAGQFARPGMTRRARSGPRQVCGRARAAARKSVDRRPQHDLAGRLDRSARPVGTAPRQPSA